MVHILCQSVFSRGTILGAVPRLNSRPARKVSRAFRLGMVHIEGERWRDG